MAATGGPARRPAAPATPASRTSAASRPLGRPAVPAAPAARRARAPEDPVAAALAIWRSVTAGLESAHYAEVGAEYAKLSALLVQQRTAQVLAGGRPGPEWAELTRTAQRALDLLEPLLGAARLLATAPTVTAAAPSSPRRAPSAPRTGRKAAPQR